MASKRGRGSGPIGFVTRWVRRIRRLATIAGVGAAVYTWWQQRRRGDPGRGSGPQGGFRGGGGSGRPVWPGGSPSPSDLRAAADPPLQPASTSASATVGSPPAGSADETAHDPAGHGELEAMSTWVDPVDGGACPPSHPIKVNEHSGIFHVPGGRFYERTDAVRCYATADAAAADGFRAAKA